MKSYFCDTEFKYDGSQLKSLFAYLKFKILGDSIVSWVGPCDIPFEQMMDAEDLIAESPIRGARMLHFIVEKFDVQLFSTVALQRLMASLAIDLIRQMSPNKEMALKLRRHGDDIYFDYHAGGCVDANNKKLSISVAVPSPSSTLMHFALNINNESTPVETLSLDDLGIEPVLFANKLMANFSQEVQSITEATQKVKSSK